MKKVLLLLVLLFSAYAAPSLAQSSCTSITSLPATIAEPGNYCLTGNQTVNMTTGTALTIAASNVVLDCANYSITNTAASNVGSSNAINIASRNSVTIRNCRILGGFTTGIRASQNNTAPNVTNYIQILDNFIVGPYLHGIFANGSAIEIRGNRIYDVGGQAGTFAAGIRVGASTLAGQFRHHLVKDNAIAGTGSASNNAYGIYSDASLASLFIHNAVTGTTATKAGYRSYGIKLLGTVNRVSDNHIVGSGLDNDTGIHAADASTDCFDNYLRVAESTVGCNATMGNY